MIKYELDINVFNLKADHFHRGFSTTTGAFLQQENMLEFLEIKTFKSLKRQCFPQYHEKIKVLMEPL